jgi:hypothetical protein
MIVELLRHLTRSISLDEARICGVMIQTANSAMRKLRRTRLASLETSRECRAPPKRIPKVSNVCRTANNQHTEELAEEGNSFEASVVDVVENAKDPDSAEVFTRQVPEDDVPEEYRSSGNRGS